MALSVDDRLLHFHEASAHIALDEQEIITQHVKRIWYGKSRQRVSWDYVKDMAFIIQVWADKRKALFFLFVCITISLSYAKKQWRRGKNLDNGILHLRDTCYLMQEVVLKTDRMSFDLQDVDGLSTIRGQISHAHQTKARLSVIQKYT